MREIHSKFIHIMIVLTMLCGALLDVNFQAFEDIDQLTASVNIVHSHEDDSLTKKDNGEPSKSIGLSLSDPEDLKLFLVLEKYFWIASILFGFINIASPVFSLAKDLGGYQLARAPPAPI